MFGERGGSVDTVIVDGRVVLRAGRSTRVDEAAILAATHDILGRVRARNVAVAAIARAVAATE